MGSGDEDDVDDDVADPNHPGFGESPGRKQARLDSYQKMRKQAVRMQNYAAKNDGNVGAELPVGTIVSIPIQNVDRAKVDATCATCVIVEQVIVGETKMMKYRLACTAGVLKSLRARTNLRPIPHVTPELMGLDDALQNWRSMPEVGERACSRNLSAVGGQGLVHCLCRGKCDGLKCSCKKAGRECNSRCHKNNSKCKNKML